MNPVRLPLPFPVPLHACFIQGRHRGGGGAPSKRYRAYAAEADAAWRAAGAPQVPGPVAVAVDLCAPTRRAQDAGNLHKCLFDNLVRLGVIEDDSNRVVISEAWRWVAGGPPCLVTVFPLGFDVVALACSATNWMR